MDRPFKVLLVEDGGFFRRAIAAALEREMFEVFTASTGDWAIDVAQRHRPDAIIMDVFMPRLNGLSVMRALKRIPETSEIPVIFLSASNDRETIQQARTLGAAEYLCKNNLSMQYLVTVLRRYAQSPAQPHMALPAAEPLLGTA